MHGHGTEVEYVVQWRLPGFDEYESRDGFATEEAARLFLVQLQDSIFVPAWWMIFRVTREEIISGKEKIAK